MGKETKKTIGIKSGNLELRMHNSFRFSVSLNQGRVLSEDAEYKVDKHKNRVVKLSNVTGRRETKKTNGNEYINPGLAIHSFPV